MKRLGLIVAIVSLFVAVAALYLDQQRDANRNSAQATANALEESQLELLMTIAARETIAAEVVQPATTPVPPILPSTSVDTPVDEPVEEPPDEPVDEPGPDLGPEWREIGATVRGEPLKIVRFGAGPNKIVLVGGLHAGSVPASVTIAERLVTLFSQNPDEIPAGVTAYVIPSVNKDSEHAPGEWEGRINANKVDLNRNWGCNWIQDATWRGNIMESSGGTEAFSEPETRALRDFFSEIEPLVVIIWAARITDGLISPGQCTSFTNTTRASYAVAKVYSSASGYPVEDYEVKADETLNGDANNWLDSEGIPNFAVILEQYEAPDWTNNLKGVRAVLASYEN